MPGWASQLLAQGVAVLILAALFVVSAVEPHVKDLVWRRLYGSIHAAATRDSRSERLAAEAAVERQVRIRSAMATIRVGVVTWANRSGAYLTGPQAAQIMADIHRGIAELRTEEPRAKAELDSVMTLADRGDSSSPQVAQLRLEALEAKLRELKE